MSKAATKLRQAAEQLRTTEMDTDARHRAAGTLDDLAAMLEKASLSVSTWAARGCLASTVLTVAMAVAGIWVDWRWLATAALPAVVAVVAGAMVVVAKEDQRA